MSNILSYHFPLDSLENRQIINTNGNVTIVSELQDSNIDFDTRRGSYLLLKNSNAIHFTFGEFIIEADKSYVINLFFNYQLLQGNASDDSFLVVDDLYSLAIRNNILWIMENPTEPLTQDTWYNITVTISRDKIKTFLFNKEINKADLSLGSIGKIKLQAGKNSNIKFSDLSIQEEVNASALKKIRSYQNAENLSVFSTIGFSLYNKSGYQDRLFLDDDTKGLFLDIDLDTYFIEFHPDRNVHLILKAKKGFFQLKESVPETASVSTEGDDFSIAIKAGTAMIKGRKIFIPLPFVGLVNLRNQDRMFVQLELTNCTLKTGDHTNMVLSGGKSVTIDRTVAIQDDRGADVCPFEVFVFGNDTLYNGEKKTAQTIILRIMNSRREEVAFGQNASFEVTSGQMGIVRDDVLQVVNIKIKNREGRELNTVKDQHLKIYVKENTVIKQNQWMDIEISGLLAKNDSPDFPSGSYPFYLEYRNIPGYRNGRARFYLRTGKIFYYYQ
ncbi:hypothetical protein [Chryseobacterium sp. sg2396]|uniref:hypothetical protein n=1 Tax=Chryseobacterium sp. sg2396 TaxID=3276280 RepID=UPI00366AE84F